jgi:hypothetical protein
LLKILDEPDMADPKTLEAFLPLIRDSFSYHPIISVQVNQEPKVTLFLLKNLKESIHDAQTERDIEETIKFVNEKTGIRYSA